MNEFNTDRLKEYLIRSGDHLKPSILGHRIRCVKSLFRWSHEEGYTLKNPVAKINNGAPIDVIQSLLGHEKSETTKMYAQLSGKLRQDLYSKYF